MLRTIPRSAACPERASSYAGAALLLLLQQTLSTDTLLSLRRCAAVARVGKRRELRMKASSEDML